MTAGRVHQSDSRGARHTAPHHAANTNKQTNKPTSTHRGLLHRAAARAAGARDQGLHHQPELSQDAHRHRRGRLAAARLRRPGPRDAGGVRPAVRFFCGSFEAISVRRRAVSYLCNQQHAILNSYLRTCKAISNRATKSSWHPDNVVQALVRAATASNPRSQVTG